MIDLLKQSMSRVSELEVKSDVDDEIIHNLRVDLESAREEIARLKDQMASPLEFRIVIDPVTGAVRHIS